MPLSTASCSSSHEPSGLLAPPRSNARAASLQRHNIRHAVRRQQVRTQQLLRVCPLLILYCCRTC